MRSTRRSHDRAWRRGAGIVAACTVAGGRYDCAGEVALRGSATTVDSIAFGGEPLANYTLDNGMLNEPGPACAHPERRRHRATHLAPCRGQGRGDGHRGRGLRSDPRRDRECRVARHTFQSRPYEGRARARRSRHMLRGPGSGGAASSTKGRRVPAASACASGRAAEPLRRLSSDAGAVPAEFPRGRRAARERKPGAVRAANLRAPGHVANAAGGARQGTDAAATRVARCGSPWIQTEPDRAIAALQDEVAGWLRAETGRTPDAAEMLDSRLRESATLPDARRMSGEIDMNEPAVTRIRPGRLARRSVSAALGARPDSGAGDPDIARVRRSASTSGSASAPTARSSTPTSRSTSSTARRAASTSRASRTGSSRRCRRSAPNTCRARAMRRSGLIYENGPRPAGRHVEAPSTRASTRRSSIAPSATPARCATRRCRSRACTSACRRSSSTSWGSRNSSSTARAIRSSAREFIVPEARRLAQASGEDLGPARSLPRLSGRRRADARTPADARRPLLVRLRRTRTGVRAASTRSTRPRCCSTFRCTKLPAHEPNAAGGLSRRSGCRDRARACSCTGTATTRWSRSATRARRSAPARRRRRSTSRSIGRIEEWLLTQEPPKYPYPIDAAQGRARRRALHGVLRRLPRRERPRLLAATSVGKVTPIAEIGTDRRRLDSYTLRARGQPVDAVRRLSVALHAFPQDLRLRQHAARRPVAARAVPAQRLGADRARPARAVASAPGRVLSRLRRLRPGEARLRLRTSRSEGERRYFKFDTRAPGNSNAGHEGKRYGTDLPAADKDALVEYLKTF